MHRLGCDYSGARPSMAALTTAGVTFVCRYLSHSAWKNLTRDEAKALSAAGIDIVSNWETTTNRARAGAEAGVQDARDALSQHIECSGGTDNRRPIYFSVDEDVAVSRVEDYFRGVVSVLGRARVGVYGSRSVCDGLRKAGLADWTWRTMSTGWSGGPGDPSEFHIVQSTKKIPGLTGVDHNIATTADFGQWRHGTVHSRRRIWSAGTGVLYTADALGTLYWYRHLDPDNGADTWTNNGARKTVGSGWQQFAHVVAAGDGVLYAVRPDGGLCWYRHLGSDGGEAKWAHDGQPRIVGSGWQQFTHVMAVGGLLYAVKPDGTLCWYRHLDPNGGEAAWANDGQPKVIGSGWQRFTHVIIADDGVIYAVRPDGGLCWYRHLDSDGGEAKWAHDGRPQTIGSGWQQFTHVTAAGDGVLYPVKPDGTLLWYRHLGSADGESRWAGDGQGKQIGRGWSY